MIKDARAGSRHHAQQTHVDTPALCPVRAGVPPSADDFIEGEIDFQRLLITNRPATFLVRVAGDSMVGKRRLDGDLAIMDRSLVPQNGDVVVVDIDGEPSFKVWKRRGGRVGLAFANPRHPAFVLDLGTLVEVWGVVSGSVKPRRRAVRECCRRPSRA